MKKGIKTFCKVLSVFLAVLFILEVLPTQVMAEAYTAAVTEKQFIEDLVNNPTDVENANSAEILYEVEEKRDEFTKVYKKTDGSYTAIVSKEPLHYLDNGVWEEIDNSLSSDGNTFTNASNIFNAIFPKSLDDDAQISIENGESGIAFYVNNISESNGVVENAIGKSDTQIDTVDNAIANTQSSITYEDVETNTDIQYIVTPNSIKENVIVSDKNSIKDSYSFTIEKGNLTCVLADDGSVSFVNSENGVEFSIPRPIMTDAALAFSYDIDVNVVDNNDGTIELIYSPSKEWTSSNDRVYPINIDPAIIVTSKQVDWIEDNCVINDSTHETDQDSNFINDFIGFVANVKETNSDGTTNTLKAEIYTKINPESFKNFGENIVFTDVQYVLAGNGYGGKIIAKEVAESYNMETVTYSSKPKHGDEVYDYYTTLYKNEADADANSEGFVFVHFNITKAFNNWLNGETNNGFVMVPEKEGTVGMFITDGVYSYTNPSTGSTTTTKYETNLIIDYVDVNGYNELYSHHSQDVGRAGTGYVNDFTQGLSVVRNDISLDGNIMPVSIAMNFGTAVSNMFEYEYSVQNPYGNGWSPNYQRMYKTNDYQIIYYTETGSEITFNIVENDDGTISFVESTTDFVGESGYAIEKVSETDEETGKVTEYYHLVRPDGYTERFNDDGFLVSVSNPNYPEQQITIKYANTGFIDCVTDGVGRKFDFVYDSNGMLSKICCLSSTGNVITAGSTTSPLEVNYSYTDNQLTKVTYADGKSINYAYNSNGHLVSMENIDGYRVVYTYDENGKVTSVKEQAKDGTEYVDGNYINYEPQSANQVKLTDALGSTEVYQFNRFGKLLYTVDNYGNYCKYDSAKAESTLIVSTSNYKANSQNFLVDPSFERYTGQLFENYELWTLDSNMSIIESDEAHTGTKVMKFESDVNTYSSQTKYFSTNDSGSYTFSAYVKSDSENPGQFTIKIYSTDESGTEIKDFYNVTTTNNDWQRYTVTIDIPSKDCGVSITFGFENSHGTFLVDDVQLEHSVSASDFNLVENGSFTNGYSQWETKGNCSIVDSSILGENVNALQFTGGVNSVNTALTIIPVDGKKGDVYSIGAWLQGVFTLSENRNSLLQALEKDNPDSFNFTKDRYAQIEVAYQYTEPNEEDAEENIEETLKEIITIPFEELLSDWQFASGSFALECDCTKIAIIVRYTNNGNPALLSNVELTRDESTTINEIVEETEENIVSDYESNVVINNETSLCICGENCSFGDGCPCTCESEANCICNECHRESSIKYDEFGNMTSISYTTFELNEILTLLFSISFSETGNYRKSQTSMTGGETLYSYNENNGLLNSITDARGSVINYSYNAMGVVEKLEKMVSNLSGYNNDSIYTEYEYTNDRISSVGRNNFSYFIDYDIWGNISQIYVSRTSKILEVPIAQYTYYDSPSQKNLVKTVSYGINGDCGIVEYSYNDRNQIVSISCGGETLSASFKYDRFGNLVKMIDELSSRDTTYNINNTISVALEDGTSYESSYDENGNTIEKIYSKMYTEVEQEVGFSLSKKDIVSSPRYSGTEILTVGLTSSKDSFFRDKEKIVTTKSSIDETDNNFAFVKTGYTYKNNNSVTTWQIDSYNNMIGYGNDISTPVKSSSTIYSYDYDANGNIIAEYDGVGELRTLRYRYSYDEAEQLVRVDDNVNKKTFVYQYNQGGNRVSTKEYKYTLSESLGSIVDTTRLLYANLYWEDKLTTYDGNLIRYDSIGSVKAYNGWDYSWNNRNLKFVKNDNTNISYSYDINGLRTMKAVYDLTDSNNKSEIYRYIWNAEKLSHVKYTQNNFGGRNERTYYAYIIYDEDSPVGMMVNSYNDYYPITNNTFLFTKNMQGDITGIIDENGNMLVSYNYDAWGNQTYTLNSEYFTVAELVFKINPFTYRGYTYDYEIGHYYLQSRYYRPDWGRFISSDIYLETGTGVLGSNVFTYCDNDAINNVDPNGYWAVDVHHGAFKKEKEDEEYKTVSFKGYYIPKNPNIPNNESRYGTFFWASAKFKPEDAYTIGDACNGVDTSLSTNPLLNQSWHFNTSMPGEIDSRIIIMTLMLLCSFSCLDEARILKNNGKKYQKEFNAGLEYLGKALHPIQDYYAHTDDKVYNVVIDTNAFMIPQSDPLYYQPNYVTTDYKSHIRLDDDTDNAIIRWEQLIKTKEITEKILEEAYKIFYIGLE